MAYQSEYALENEVLQQLEELNYERVNIHNIKLEINEYLKELGVLKMNKQTNTPELRFPEFDEEWKKGN